MASCHKCGKPKLRKRRSDGVRWCRRCGAMPGLLRLNRYGVPAPQPKEVTK